VDHYRLEFDEVVMSSLVIAMMAARSRLPFSVKALLRNAVGGNNRILSRLNLYVVAAADMADSVGLRRRKFSMVLSILLLLSVLQLWLGAIGVWPFLSEVLSKVQSVVSLEVP
jgi:hypothetical protein